MAAFGLGFLAGFGERGQELQRERVEERQRRFDVATKILTEITLPALEKDRALREERIKVIRAVAQRTGQSIRKAKTALDARGFGEKNRADVIEELLREPQDIRDLSIDEQIEELRKATPAAQRQNPAEFFIQEKNKVSAAIFGRGFSEKDAAAVGRAGGLVPRQQPSREVISGVGGQQAPPVGVGTPPITPQRQQAQVPSGAVSFSRDIPIKVEPKVLDVLIKRTEVIEDDQTRGIILARLGAGIATRKELDIITAEITRAEKVKEVDLKDLTSELASVKDIVKDPQAAAVALATGDVAGFIRTIQSAPKEAQLLAGTTAFTRELRSAVVSTANLPFKLTTNERTGEKEFIFTALSASQQIKANALIDTANEFAIQAQAAGKQLNANSFASAARIAIESNNSFLDGAIEDSETPDKFAELVVSEIDRAVTPAQANYIRERANEKIVRSNKFEFSPQDRADVQDAVNAKREGVSREEESEDRITALAENFAETISSLGKTEAAQAVFNSLPSNLQQKVLQILNEEEAK